MTKFIKLTNANKELEGETLIISRDSIVTVFTMPAKEDRPESSTLIFCPPHGTWEVKESAEEVYQLLGN